MSEKLVGTTSLLGGSSGGGTGITEVADLASLPESPESGAMVKVLDVVDGLPAVFRWDGDEAPGEWLCVDIPYPGGGYEDGIYLETMAQLDALSNAIEAEGIGFTFGAPVYTDDGGYFYYIRPYNASYAWSSYDMLDGWTLAEVDAIIAEVVSYGWYFSSQTITTSDSGAIEIASGAVGTYTVANSPVVRAYASLAAFVSAAPTQSEGDATDLTSEGVRLIYTGGSNYLSSGIEGQVMSAANSAAMQAIIDALAAESIFPVTDFVAILTDGSPFGGSELIELAHGITGNRLATIDGLTEHQTTGVTKSISGTSRRFTLAAGGDYVASFTLLSGTTIADLLATHLDAMMEFVSGSSADYSFGAFLLFDNNAANLASGVWIGSSMTSSGTYFSAGAAEEPTHLYAWRDTNATETLGTDTISESGPLHVDAIISNMGRDTGTLRTYRVVSDGSRWDNATALDQAVGGSSALTLAHSDAYTRVRLVVAIHELGGVGDLVVDLHSLQGWASEHV